VRFGAEIFFLFTPKQASFLGSIFGGLSFIHTGAESSAFWCSGNISARFLNCH
jgi:hypothetical protein